MKKYDSVKAERLKEFRKYCRMSQKEFAKELGMSQSSYSFLENCVSKIDERTILSLQQVFNLNRKWFESGEGSYKNVNEEEDFLINTFKTLNMPNKTFLLNMVNELNKMQSIQGEVK